MNSELLAQLTLSMSKDDSYTPSWLKVQIEPGNSTDESQKQKLNPWAQYPTKLFSFTKVWHQIVQVIDVKGSQLRSVIYKSVVALKNQKFSPIKG